jgi:large subunit ribosomal protein L17
MRHHRKTQNLSRFSSFFKATLRQLARSVIERQSIVTTRVKAKVARGPVERLITLGKRLDSIEARRRAFAVLQDHALVQRLFNEIAPMFADRQGGYTRIIPYMRRRGDNAEMVIFELSVQKETPRPTTPSAEKEKAVVDKKQTAERVKAQLKDEPETKKETPKKPSDSHKGAPKKEALTAKKGLSKLFKKSQNKGSN